MVLMIKNIGTKFPIEIKIHNMDEILSFSNWYISRGPKHMNFRVRY